MVYQGVVVLLRTGAEPWCVAVLLRTGAEPLCCVLGWRRSVAYWGGPVAYWGRRAIIPPLLLLSISKVLRDREDSSLVMSRVLPSHEPSPVPSPLPSPV